VRSQPNAGGRAPPLPPIRLILQTSWSATLSGRVIIEVHKRRSDNSVSRCLSFGSVSDQQVRARRVRYSGQAAMGCCMQSCSPIGGEGGGREGWEIGEWRGVEGEGERGGGWWVGGSRWIALALPAAYHVGGRLPEGQAITAYVSPIGCSAWGLARSFTVPMRPVRCVSIDPDPRLELRAATRLALGCKRCLSCHLRRAAIKKKKKKKKKKKERERWPVHGAVFDMLCRSVGSFLDTILTGLTSKCKVRARQ